MLSRCITPLPLRFNVWQVYLKTNGLCISKLGIEVFFRLQFWLKPRKIVSIKTDFSKCISELGMVYLRTRYSLL